MRSRYPIGFSLAIALALFLSLAQLGAAQATGSITLHKRVCPAGTTGNVFDECHDNAPEQAVSFSLDGGAAELVDASGDLTFDGLAAGTYQIAEVEGIPLEFVNLKVWCSIQGDNPTPFEVTTDGPNFSVDLGDGEAVVCDVYNIAENLSGLTPTPAPVVTQTPSIQLPNTGSGTASGNGFLMTVSYGLMLAALALTTIGLARRMVDSDRPQR
jgi:hypothetical protein